MENKGRERGGEGENKRVAEKEGGGGGGGNRVGKEGKRRKKIK